MNLNYIVKLLDYFRLFSIWLRGDDALPMGFKFRAVRIIDGVNLCSLLDRSVLEGRGRGGSVSLYG